MARSPERRTGDATVRIPAGLTGPIELELAKPAEEIPGPTALPGGTRYEPKYDGFRAALVRQNGTARLWSRQGKDLTDRFPDIAAAAVLQLPDGVVLDGELVVYVDGRLSFDTLKRRTAARARQQAAARPATYVAFDLLAIGGIDLRTQRWTSRRTRLEQLAAPWRPPLQLTMVTADIEEAQLWFDVLPESGIEGLVCKGAAARYVGGHRGFIKVKRRDTVDVIIGAVIGPLERPEAIVVGRYRDDGLRIYARSTPLTARQAREIAAELTAAGPHHPWPDEITNSWSSGRKVHLTKVEPRIVAEVDADVATQAGDARHTVRFVRSRPDLDADDVAPFPDL